MPIKYLKQKVGTKLRIERILFRKRHTLILDRSRCKGCDLCKTVCPREAIELIQQPKKEGKAKSALIDINPTKCHYCGICVCICPFGALTILVDHKPFVSVEETESFPRLLKEVTINAELCDPNCRTCMDSCPLGIQLYMIKKGALDLCPCCTWCQRVCETEGAIRVQKIFTGTIKVHQEKCPEECSDCLDVCPVNALYLDEKNKVRENNAVCIYCKACLNVCPVEGALEVHRISIRHTPVKSGAWNRALEKLTSEVGLVKELKSKSAIRAMEVVRNRFSPESDKQK